MAAGRGVRMMPLTAVIPKPMAPYLGSTLIADGIRRIRGHVDVIHITVGYKGPKLAEHVIELGVDCVYNTSGKGNSWWIYNTMLKYLDEPLLVLTCDNVVELDFEQLEREYARHNSPACMVVPVAPSRDWKVTFPPAQASGRNVARAAAAGCGCGTAPRQPRFPRALESSLPDYPPGASIGGGRRARLDVRPG